MTDETLLEYLRESELQVDNIKETVDLPNIDLEALLKQEIAAENGTAARPMTSSSPANLPPTVNLC